MPLNIRAKPSHGKLTPAAAKSGGQNDGSSSHSRFSRSAKQGKGKQAVSSGPGSRSGLEPGSVSGGGPPPAAKLTGAQGSVSKVGSRLKVNTSTADKGSARGSATAPGGKTMSMENIQSLSAAYATSGAMYPNERESLENSGGYPKSTMTLGRSTSRSSYTGRSTAIGSTPNITTSGMHHISDSCGDPTVFSTGTSSLRRQFGRCTQTLDSDDRGEVSTCDLQAQLRDLQRENESLRRELDGGRDGKTGYGTNSVNFWSPDVKRDKGSRREEGVRTPALKEQCRVNQEDLQLGDIRRNKQLPLTVQELQEELRAHRETNTRLRQQRQQSSSYREHHMDQEFRGGLSPGHSPRQSSINLHSPAPKNSPKASPSNTYNPRQQEADIIIHSPGYGCNTLAATQRLSPANTLQPGQRNSPSQPLYSPSQGALPSSSPRHPCSPCQVPGCDGFSSPPPQDPTEENFFRLQSEHERQANELSLLRKTMEEMEMRIDSQKQTLGARDESIQRLLEMLQGQGQWGRGQRTGIITMAAQEADVHLENMHLREDTKISSLERNIRDLEDDVQMLKTTGLLHPNERQDELKQVEVYKSHSKFMKTKEQTLSPCVSSIRPTPTFLMPTQLPWITEQEEIEQLKQELNRKDSEMQALQTKLETLTNQNSDYKQHIEVLKESLGAKEQRANTLQTEVDALRVRLEEKEQILTKKTKQLQDLSDEKSTLAGEIRDMKDMLDVKERKVNILQKKIENLLEQLKDKDKQLVGLRERVQGLQTDSSNTDTALATLEEALSEKERVIENLRDQKEREERVRLEEMDQMRRENQELKEKLAALQPPKLPQSQVTNSILIQNQRPDGEVEPKVDGFPAVNPMTPKPEETVRICPDIADRLRLLEQEVARYREESGKSQAEVERLKGALKDAEVDKSCKEKKITDLERPGQIKSPNIQKQIVPGEMRKDALADGHPHSLSQLCNSQDAMRETAERIMELEKALRDTMNTSAHREALWAQEEAARVQAQRQLEELMGALEKTRQELDATKVRLSSTQKCLHDRDGHLNQLRQERRKQLEEILEMKQQALLAAISEKDANIALLELSSSKRKKAQEEVMALKREKDRLMHQLKQQTQSRMKLIADNYEEDYIHPQHHPHHLHHMHTANLHHRSLPRGDPHANHRPPMDQDDEEGIWA
ncbi:ELKS/Rab6-interacting/CAST family member 1-like isoform X1 [Poecilia latipinna]|uniref:ELKS/Rab6-interacting/CAST family member 1-like isoform X1 n=1 Tax=Poecilia latipinna TaxID=48699 RepID=UPI00072EB6C5|nr:PREDICTED: ELKS/Rab6-interacting/CAST family member 1-like isoform X1 [Poecilia latipinna]